MANLIYGLEDTAVWPQTGIQTEVTGVRVRKMTYTHRNDNHLTHCIGSHWIITLSNMQENVKYL